MALAILDTSYESSLAIFDVSYESQFTAISVASLTDAENVVDANVTITDADAAEPTIYVIPKDPNSGWRHFMFELNNANGQQPNFEVENNRVSNFDAAWVPLYTYDFVTWHRGSSYTLDTGTTPGRYNFQFDEAFNQDTVWVASHPTFRHQDMVDFVSDLLTNHSSVASVTTSGDASGVIGQSLADEDDSSTDPDRTVGPFDLYAVKLEWGGSTTDGAEKRQMGILLGSHGGEVIDGYMMQGAVDWMLNDSSDDAVRFRSNWNVFIYGLHAVNSRWAGESRVNPDRFKDPNRDWGDTDFDLTESVTIRDAIEADMQVGGGGSKDMHAFFSFHGAGLSTSDILWYPAFGSTDESAYGRFKTAMENLDPDPISEQDPIDGALASRWMHEQYGAQVAVAPEGQMEGDPDPARYEEVGALYVQAVSIADGDGEFVEGTLVSVSVSENSTGNDSFSVVVTSPVSVVENSLASDIYTAIANVASNLTESVSAGDSDTAPASALGSISESSTGNDLVDAVGQISASIAEGAQSGESWVAQAQMLVSLVEDGAAGETLTNSAADVQIAAIEENSVASNTFLAAVQTIGSITESASTTDSIVTAVTAVCAITENAVAQSSFSTGATKSSSILESVQSQSLFNAVSQILSSFTENVDVSAVITASASVQTSISSNAIAGDSWVTKDKDKGYLVIHSITLTAALSGTTEIQSKLSNSVSIYPKH